MKIKIETVTVGERGQVVIPQDFREDIDIKPHEKLIVVKMGSVIVYRKMEDVLTEKLIKTLQKGLKGLTFKDVERERARVDEELMKK